MTESRVGDRERTAHAWYGAPQEGQVPARADAAGGVEGGTAPTETGVALWARRIKRVLRDAMICTALIVAVPVGLTLAPAWSGWAMRSPGWGNTVERLHFAERIRHLAVAKDPAIRPAQAGLALAALGPTVRNNLDFPQRPAVARFARPWNNTPIPATLQVGSKVSSWYGPNSLSIIGHASRGLSPKEIAYLKVIATAPVWPAYDLVARAPMVDVLGGRFLVPFPDNAQVALMPSPSFSASKELAYASVSRAAYYLAIGKPAEADAVLRGTIGFGFVFIDNATDMIDALIGRVIVGIGRQGLEDLYLATGDPRLADVRAGIDPGNLKPYPMRQATTTQELRENRIANAADRALPRAVRLQNLYLLAQSVCTNPRELLLGPAQDVRDAFALGARELARFPSERALLDLMLQSPNRPVPSASMPDVGPLRVLIGTATIASIITDNPRMAYCTRLPFMNR